MSNLLSSALLRRSFILDRFSQWNPPPLFFIYFFCLQDAVINLKTLQEISRQLGFEWTVLAYELGFNRTEIGRFHASSTEKSVQAKAMLESW